MQRIPNWNGGPLRIEESNIVLRGEGLRGENDAITYRNASDAREQRATEGDPGELERGLAEAELEDRHNFEMQMRLFQAAEGRQEGENGMLTFEIPNEDSEEPFAVVQNAKGACQFIYPFQQTGPSEQEPVLLFRISISRDDLEATDLHETAFGTPGKFLVKVIYRKLIRPLLGRWTASAVTKWEDRHYGRPTFHGGTIDDALSRAKPPFKNWRSITSESSNLLLLHGTFSNTHGAFGGLNNFPTLKDKLHAKYGDRVVAFDHPTLCRNIADNAADFLDSLPPRDRPYRFDVISHSRGGLLGRTLHDPTSRIIPEFTRRRRWRHNPKARIKIERLIMVGTPNHGTPFADPKNLPRYLDLLATLLNLTPSTCCIAIGGLLACAADLASDLMGALPGIAAQAQYSDGSTSTFINSLTTATPPRDLYKWPFMAVLSDYKPSGLPAALASLVKHGVFANKENDLVVPTASMTNDGALNTYSSTFALKFISTPAVHHTNYFNHEETWERILCKWLRCHEA